VRVRSGRRSHASRLTFLDALGAGQIGKVKLAACARKSSHQPSLPVRALRARLMRLLPSWSFCATVITSSEWDRDEASFMSV
jgi:hypothetical protein